MVTRSESVKLFLEALAPPELSKLYHLGMECQVNVAQDGGERIDGEFRGRKWHGWSDGATTWKTFRIPYKADTNPEYSDKEIRFDLADHAEGIGMTGWDWQRRVSCWVAYDFDAIMGHSEKHQAKLTHDQLERVRQEAEAIEWVTVRHSAGGKGLHLYVMLEDVPTANHTEHAALARAILGKMSALCAFDFESKVDICGGNMWVWHRKARGVETAFKILKQGIKMPSDEVPPCWKDHVKVVNRSRRKTLNQAIGSPESFDDLTSQNPKVALDEGHQRLIKYLKENKCLWWWDSDHWSLTTHTFHLKQAYKDLGFRGVFDTMSIGRESETDHNCFMFPMRKGGWIIRRYSKGVSEHPSWDQDGAGWTRTYLNREADLNTAARSTGGVEDIKGGFVFNTADEASEAAKILGVALVVGESQTKRRTRLVQHKDGRLIVEVDADPSDDGGQMKNWLNDKKKWVKIHSMANSTPDEPELGNYDDLVRHLVTSTGEDYGWVCKSDDQWRVEPLTHIRAALASLGFSAKETTSIVGSSVFKPWRLVTKPFQEEYPGDRQWNRNAAQFRFSITRDKDKFDYPTWMKVLNHCGQGLDDAVKEHPWCSSNGILTGGDYLKCWIASLVQNPTRPLPYLCLFGPQNSGKSILHEALKLLFTTGYKRADVALTSQSNFNAELEGAILCVVEETDLRTNKQAYNRIKDYVTSLDLLIHKKGQTPYHVDNTTHWIQCTNDYRACPINFGDTRITMIQVPELDPLELIPKIKLIEMLEKEASDFIAEIIRLEVPESPDRLNIPVVETQEKELAAELSMDPVDTYLKEKCLESSGNMLLFADIYIGYLKWAEVNGEMSMSKIKFGKKVGLTYPKSRSRKTGALNLGNISWRVPFSQPLNYRLVAKGDYLERIITPSSE